MDHKVTIIAEAGVNHNGDICLAKKLIEEAAKAGADFVKFQSFKTESGVTKYAVKADYQKANSNSNETQFEMLKKLELSKEQQILLYQYCLENKIRFLSTPFDLESAEELNQMGMDIFKISSGDITNLPLLRKIGSFRKKVILSTGMSTLEEISDALKVLCDAGTKIDDITVLHCNTEYPTPYEDVNLYAMLEIRDKLKVAIGYSDHTLGIEVPIAAVALGAKIIEKHFTLDRNLPGPDHKASLIPQELTQMISSIRNIEKSLGIYQKIPTPSEIKNLVIARKSIVAKCKIKKGEIFSEENLTVKRPGNGLSPMLWDKVIGQKAPKDFEVDEQIFI